MKCNGVSYASVLRLDSLSRLRAPIFMLSSISLSFL